MKRILQDLLVITAVAFIVGIVWIHQTHHPQDRITSKQIPVIAKWMNETNQNFLNLKSRDDYLLKAIMHMRRTQCDPNIPFDPNNYQPAIRKEKQDENASKK
jgi:flagellar basal body-associated protein FliL